jgi:hypothetical protein
MIGIALALAAGAGLGYLIGYGRGKKAVLETQKETKKALEDTEWVTQLPQVNL